MKKESMMDKLKRLDEWREKGVDYEEEAEMLLKQLKGMDIKSVEAGKICSRLGVAYGEMGEVEEEVKYCKLALRIFLNVLGEGAMETADAYYALGGAFAVMEDYGMGLKMYKEALRIYRERLGMAELTADACFAVGNMYVEMFRHADALEWYREGLKMRWELLGEQHTSTADGYSDVGSMLFCLERYEEALMCHERALDIREHLLGEMHRDTALSYYEIGNVYYCMMEPVLATDNYEIALRIQLQVLEDDDTDLADTYLGLGQSLLLQKEYRKAIKNLEEALLIYQDSMEDERAEDEVYEGLGEGYYKLGEMCCEEGDLLEGVKLMERAAEYLKKVPYETLVGLSMVYNRLGDLYLDLKNEELSMKYYKLAMK